MPSVFLSYSSKDTALAKSLVTLLRTYGDAVFFSDDSIEEGEDDWKTIIRALEGADIVLLAATHNACMSPGVRREMIEAQRRGKKVIPLLSGVTPEELKKRLGDVLQVKQAVPIDDPVKWAAFLQRFGKKTSNGNLLAGAILGALAVVILAAIFAPKKK